MRKNTCILIRNWRKLLWNTEESAAHAKICKHRRWILRWQTLSVTSRAAAHPWVRVYVFQGEWELTHPGRRNPTPSQNRVLLPQAPSRHSLETGPTHAEACGFPGAGLTQQGAIAPTWNPAAHSTGVPQFPLMADTKQQRWVPLRDSSTRLFS